METELMRQLNKNKKNSTSITLSQYKLQHLHYGRLAFPGRNGGEGRNGKRQEGDNKEVKGWKGRGKDLLDQCQTASYAPEPYGTGAHAP